MPIKQEFLSFPIRKAVTSQSKPKRAARVIKKSNVENLDTEVIDVDTPTSGNTAVDYLYGLNPRKSLRQRTPRSTVTLPKTRRSARRKDHPVYDCDSSISPEGRQVTIPDRRLCFPKKLTHERESSPELDSPSRHSSRSLTPRKKTVTGVKNQESPKLKESPTREASASPRKPVVRANERSDWDEKLCTPKKPLLRRESSPETSSASHRCSGASNRSITPNRNVRGWEGEQGHHTPSKRKILSPDMADVLSPSKRPVVALGRIPNDYVNKLPGMVSPSINCVESAASPQSKQSTPLRPVQLCSPNKSGVTAKAQMPKVEKAPKSPTGQLSTAVPHTSDNLATGTSAECRSPTRSAVKRLNMNSPLKSPMKPLLLSSPRRSPRKFRDENAASPQKSQRKTAPSSLSLSSPSSLVSRLSMNSPSCRKNLAVGLFKPDVSVYRALRQSLSTATPSVLVCREKQADEISKFLTLHLTKGKPGSLYISGAPGTGKTASLNSNMETIGAKRVKKIFLNCMTLKTAAAIYKAIAAELGASVSNSERGNRNAIEEALTTSKHPILLMLDEVDQLDSKNQEVLYTIFEWPALPSSSLVLVGIANSLDLTDRILPRLQARPYFKPKLLHFPPYSKAEIVQIINHRIKEAGIGDVQVIRPSAIQLLAGKVAAIAGDVRKALDVCRRAVELCEGQACRQAVLKPSNASPRKASDKPANNAVPRMVEIPLILSIFNEVYGSRVVSAVTGAPESFPIQQKILICCLLLIFKYARSKDITLGKFHEVYIRVCKKQQVPGMDQTEFLSVCTLLESRGLLQVKRKNEVRSSKVLLLLNAKEAEEVLGDRNLLATVLEDRESLGKLCSQKI